MIGSQFLKPKSFEQQLVARAHKKKAHRRIIIIALSLTSMVDMFSLLVIFLLQSFSASPELVITKGIILPESSSAAEVNDAPVLSLSKNLIYLDQKLVGNTDNILKNPDALMHRLEDLRVLWQKTHPRESFRGEINLQAHKDVSSVTISQVMGMLPSQGYSSIQLAVVAGGRGI